MRVVQMTLDEELVRDVDKAVKRMGTTRSAFARLALQQAVARIRTAAQVERHRQGYLRKPVGKDEFAVWEKEQKWGEG